jgi:hypothetical protein
MGAIRTEYRDVVGRSMRSRHQPCVRAWLAVATVWNWGAERARGAGPVVEAERAGASVCVLDLCGWKLGWE